MSKTTYFRPYVAVEVSDDGTVKSIEIDWDDSAESTFDEDGVQVGQQYTSDEPDERASDFMDEAEKILIVRTGEVSFSA